MNKPIKKLATLTVVVSSLLLGGEALAQDAKVEKDAGGAA